MIEGKAALALARTIADDVEAEHNLARGDIYRCCRKTQLVLARRAAVRRIRDMTDLTNKAIALVLGMHLSTVSKMLRSERHSGGGAG